MKKETKQASSPSPGLANHKKPSIKDIANEAGVTISTVSHVLNKSKFVTPTTAKKVRSVVEKLGYRPNKIARSLRTQSTEAVGVIVPDLKNPFYAIIIQEMERVARQRGYTLILGCTFFDLDEEKHQMQILIDQFADGLIFFGGYDCVENLQFVRDLDIPIVAVDREVEDTSIPSVLTDNVSACAMAVDHLASVGHREIGYVTFSYDRHTVVRRRLEGFKLGLERNGLDYNPKYVLIDDSTKLRETVGTYETAMDYFSDKPLPSAFVTLSDNFAYGLIRALEELGYAVPEDVSVIGFCDNKIGDIYKPRLTTVVQNMELMGEKGMSMLIDLIEEKRHVDTRVVLQAELLKRDSVLPPKATTKVYTSEEKP
ncbi:MAG: LacI family DNA-binding transcriptional regulator [Spirochaetia bacterium]